MMRTFVVVIIVSLAAATSTKHPALPPTKNSDVDNIFSNDTSSQINVCYPPKKGSVGGLCAISKLKTEVKAVGMGLQVLDVGALDYKSSTFIADVILLPMYVGLNYEFESTQDAIKKCVNTTRNELTGDWGACNPDCIVHSDTVPEAAFDASPLEIVNVFKTGTKITTSGFVNKKGQFTLDPKAKGVLRGETRISGVRYQGLKFSFSPAMRAYPYDTQRLVLKTFQLDPLVGRNQIMCVIPNLAAFQNNMTSNNNVLETASNPEMLRMGASAISAGLMPAWAPYGVVNASYPCPNDKINNDSYCQAMTGATTVGIEFYIVVTSSGVCKFTILQHSKTQFLTFFEMLFDRAYALTDEIFCAGHYCIGVLDRKVHRCRKKVTPQHLSRLHSSECLGE